MAFKTADISLILLIFTSGTVLCHVSDDFEDLVNSYWQWRLEDAPEFASTIGEHRYDERVEQFTIPELDKRKENATNYVNQLATINRTELTRAQQVSYDVLKDTLETYLAGHKWKNYGPMNPVNFLEGLWTDTEAVAPIDPQTYDDFEHYIERIYGWADQALNYIKRMRASIKAGTTNHWVSVERAIDQIDNLVGSSVIDCPMYKPLNETLDNSTLPENNKTSLRENASITINYFRTNFNTLKRFLLEEYKNATRKSYGVNMLPNGEEYYKACLKWHLSFDISPEEIHQKGLQEVDRIHTQMVKVMSSLGYNKKNTGEFFNMLNNQPKFFMNSPEEAIEYFKSLINERIKPKLPLVFKDIPDDPVVVKEMPYDGPGGTYSFGTTSPGVFYANVNRLKDNPKYSIVSLTLHESDPGHHLQDIYAQHSVGIPIFQRVTDYNKYFNIPYHFPFYTAFTEGWALYAESLGESNELDIYKDGYELMGRYRSEIFRACRLVVDTGLHHYNWTRTRAIDYMLKYTSFTQQKAEIEIDRYITWPGQATAYKIGEMKIRELRKRAEDKLGTRFDIKDFHSVVLNNGAIPLSVLERIVDDWIDTVQASVVLLNTKNDFDELVDRYWSWRLQDAPEFATATDADEFAGQVEDFDLEILDTRMVDVTDFLNQLKKIDREKLDAGQQVSYDVLKDTLETFLAGYKWKYYGPMNPVNFLEGIWTDPESEAPSNPQSYDDFDNYISRISGWAEQALDFIKRMRKAIQIGTTNHWVSVEGAVGQLDKLVGNSVSSCPMFKPMKETLDNSTLSSKEKTTLRNNARRAITEFRNNFIALKKFVVGEYKNSSRQSYGVNSMPDGEAYYKACLMWHLSVDISPEEIHQKGLQEVERIHGNMIKVMSRLGFNGPIKEFFEKLNNDSQFFMKTPEETIQYFNTLIFKRIKPELPKLFKNIPDSPVLVKEMPNDGPGGTYTFGSPDGSRPGVFHANVKRPKDNPTYGVVSLTLHEADPGHHLQDIYAQNAVGIPTFQKVVDDNKYFTPPYHFPIYTSYLEGWALYAESLGEKEYLNIYRDDNELMGRYSDEIFRACRLVVDTGLHHYNWTRDRAIEYMLNYTAASRPSLTIEIDRYITWPGQATAYKIGELKIRELRQKAKEQLGDLFDIREFHSVILESGAIPLSVLENLVNEWIDSVNKDSFEKISSEFWEWRMKNSPEYSTTLQMFKYNDRLNSYKYDKFESDRAGAQGFQDRLVRINKNNLPNEKKISYDVLDNILRTFLAGYKWKDYGPLNPINFLEGWTVGFDFFVSGTPFDTQGDFINYARRLELAPTQIEEMMNLSKIAIAKGLTNHNASVSRVPDQLAGMIQMDPVKSELYQPVMDSLEDVFPSPYQRSYVQRRIQNAIRNFMQKLMELKDFVQNEYMPQTRTGLGIGSLPNGTEHYKACLLFHTSSDITPEEVHQKGLKEVARIEQRMRKSMAKIGFSASTSIQEMYRNLTSDKRFLLKTPEETLARFKSLIYDKIQPEISKYINHAPNLPLDVRASASDGIGGEYWTGTPDGSRPGIFYANVHRPEYNPTYKMVSLSLHEAIPGHHLAESFGILADVPKFRKYFEWLSYPAPYFFPFYNAFAEGWALYAEYLGEEMGIYQDDYEMLGRFSDEMLRATRLVIDSGIHYYNWTRERSISYMLNYTAETPDSAAIEIDRYATWPGQACGYKIGELKIKDLRQKASNALGSKFNLADFHYTILKNGAMPLDVLERVVDDWIQSTKTSAKDTRTPEINAANDQTVGLFQVLVFMSLVYNIFRIIGI